MKAMQMLVLAALISTALLCKPAAAQSKGAVEMGYDLGFSVLMMDSPVPQGDGVDVVQIGLPGMSPSPGGLLQTLRFGFYADPQSELETQLGFSNVNVEGSHLLQFGLGLSYLYNFGSADTRPYVRGGGRVYVIDGDGPSSASQMGLGIGVGAKSRIGDRMALRYEASLGRGFESDEFLAHWDVGLSFGISMFTK